MIYLISFLQCNMHSATERLLRFSFLTFYREVQLQLLKDFLNVINVNCNHNQKTNFGGKNFQANDGVADIVVRVVAVVVAAGVAVATS